MSLTLAKLPIKNYYYPLPWETTKTKGQKEELKTYVVNFSYTAFFGDSKNVATPNKYLYYSPFESIWLIANIPTSPINPYTFPKLDITSTTTTSCNVNIVNNSFDGYASFRSWRTATNYSTEIHRSPDGDGSFWAFLGSAGLSPIGSSSIASIKLASVVPTLDLVQSGTGIFDSHSGSIKFKYEQPVNIYRRSSVNGKDLDLLFGTEQYKDENGTIDDVCGCYINSSNAKLFVGNDFFKINGTADQPENMLWFTSGGSAGLTLNFYNEDGSVEAAQYYSHRGVDYNLDYRIDYFYRYTSSLYPNLVTGWYLTDFSKFYETLESEKGVYKFTTTPTATNSNQTNTYTLTWVKLTADAPDKSDITITYYGSSRRNCYNYLVNGSKDFEVNFLRTSQEVL